MRYNKYYLRPTLTQHKRSSDRNSLCPLYYGFENSSSDSAITAALKDRGGQVMSKIISPQTSLVETVQTTADQLSKEDNFSPEIGDLSPPDP